MAKKKVGEKQGQPPKRKKSAAQTEADSLKNIFDIALLKAKRIHEKYDINKSENSNLFIPKR